MKVSSEVIKQAKSWLGVKEGSKEHKEIIDIYNSHKPLARGYKVKYTDNWCATFVSAVAISLGYTDIMPTECGCQKMIELYKKIGCWIENENRVPNPGDVIFYDWDDNGKGDNIGWSDHVGIVEKVSNGKVTIIEGNYSNQVKRRTLSVNGKYIRGYAVPKYDEETVNKGGSVSVQSEQVSNKFYPKCESKYVSIVDALKSIKVDSSFSYRKKIAKANGINLYMGTFNQNIKLLNLLKIGKLKKV